MPIWNTIETNLEVISDFQVNTNLFGIFKVLFQDDDMRF